MKRNKEKANVLFVLLQLSTGGSERVVLDLARHLDKKMLNVYVAFFSGGSLLGDFREACDKIFHVPRKSGIDFNTMFELSRIIKQYDIDVINPHHYAPFFYSYPGSKIFQRRSLVYTEHAVSEIERLPEKHKMICKFLFYDTNAIIGVSKEITDCFIKKFPAHSRKIHHITNGVEIEQFSKRGDRDFIRAKLGIQPSHFVIGTIANFRRVKNHACLVHAFHLLISTFPHIRLVLVGTGVSGPEDNTENEIKTLVNSLGLENRVIFTGYRNDIPELLKSFDVFCLPSFSEGLPVAILEAMASGVTVVGSDVQGNREVIADGSTGLLFPSDNPESLAKAIRGLITEPAFRSKLIHKATEYVSHTHGISQSTAKYQEAFLKCIEA